MKSWYMRLESMYRGMYVYNIVLNEEHLLLFDVYSIGALMMK